MLFSSDSCPMAYDSNPLLCCYIIVEESSYVTYDYAKQCCANDGGALLLIDSKEKLAEIQILLGNFFFFDDLISGID